MLVLTRKTNEEILIGDNIKLTLVRVRGNSVRIGIEAPKDVRIVRGELQAFGEQDNEIDDQCDQVFAHPQAKFDPPTKRRSSDNNRVSHLMDDKDDLKASATERSIFVGRVHRPESSEGNAAPLARFMSPR